MVSTSWIVTLSPLVIALGTTAKAFISGEALSVQEVELIKYLVAAFIGSGGIGAYLKAKGKQVA